MGWGYGWQPYVPVAERRWKAMQKVEKMKKKGQTILPVKIAGRKIAETFWGKAWCDNLEAYSDYSNRLPRGRTYVRNGSVIDLQIKEGQVEALVSGSDLYSVKININPLNAAAWKAIQKECTGRITSLLDLLSGRLSGAVMEIVTKKQTGLFPMPAEMSFNCSCPDWASMCKHVAAVLYGVGARLDQTPALLFGLRGVDHGDLVTAQAAAKTAVSAGVREKMIADDQLSEIFGIDIDTGIKEAPLPVKRLAGKPKTVPEKKKVTKGAKGKTTAKIPAKKKAAVTTKKPENKAKRQPAKKTLNKTTSKKSTTKPKPAGSRKPKRGKVGANAKPKT